jgi:hypothetical protein
MLAIYVPASGLMRAHLPRGDWLRIAATAVHMNRVLQISGTDQHTKPDLRLTDRRRSGSYAQSK